MTLHDLKVLLNEIDRHGVLASETKQQALAYVNAEIAQLEALYTDLSMQMPVPAPDRRLSEDEERRRRNILSDLRCLEGVESWTDVGIVDPRVDKWLRLDAKPPLSAWTEWKQKLESAPAPRPAGKYRYKGKPYKHHLDAERCAVPGQIIELSAVQAHAWRDRFEFVSESESQTK